MQASASLLPISLTRAVCGSFFRICVGRHLANNYLFINMAYMLWMFNIDSVLGDDGKPVILIDETLNLGLVV